MGVVGVVEGVALRNGFISIGLGGVSWYPYSMLHCELVSRGL